MSEDGITHTFEAAPGTEVEYYTDASGFYLKRHGFGMLYGPLENEEHAQGVIDEFEWVLYVEPEPEEPVEPATEEKPDDG